MKKERIETILEEASASLTREQKKELWGRIKAETVLKEPVLSPYLFIRNHKKTMAPIIAALVLVLGFGGTAIAAENARPGDLLFPIDQAVEDVRLALATSDEEEARLKIAFAEERLDELRSLLEEDNSSNASQNDTTGAGTITQFKAEADIFSDTTIVKLELNDQKTTFETDATTREAIIDDIVTRVNVDRATVEAALAVEVESRVRRVSDLSDSVSSDDDRVQTAVTLIEELTDSLSNADQARFVNELLSSVGNTARIEVRKDNDGDARIEIGDDDTSTRIEEKDGEVKVWVREDDNAHDSSDDNASRSSGSFEAEADIFSDTTIVKVELNDQKTTFETDATTREAIIDDIVTRVNVDRATVEAALAVEVESRVRRADDSGKDDSKDSSSRSDDHDSRGDADGRVKVEVRVEEGIAEVRLEYGEKRDEFETAYTGTSSLITLLSNRSGLPEATISSALDLEIKD